MSQLKINTAAAFDAKMNSYNEQVKPRIAQLRNLVIEAAEELESLNTIEETLKWGEPSFVTTHGSTIRMDWKEKTPSHYSLFFKCTSKLVPTFIALYGHLFHFEGTREIAFKLDDEIPEQELKQCIKAALMYHKVKHLPHLGILT